MKQSLSILMIMISMNTISYSQIWTALQNLKVEFKIKNAGISVDGKFTDVSANVSVDEKNFENSTFNGVIQTKSVNTDNSLRDGHLKNKNQFFNVVKYPTITMKAIKVGSNKVGGSYKVDWLLTIKGISKKITTDVLVNVDGRMMFVLTVFQINRNDWKVGDKSILMSDNVLITISGNILR
jgi:polyisoprenoid-binding protein YceI